MKAGLSERRKYRNSEDEFSRRSLFSTPTKRRKRDHHHSLTKVQTESFVMKLFDRSLDLSKYTEKTPLYPICRAWIANQPRNPNLMSFKDLKEPVRRENNGAELLNRIQRDEPTIISALPAPLNIEVPKKLEIDSDEKPNLEALNEALKQDTLDEGGQDIALEVLHVERAKILADHKEKWKNIKKKWRQHSMNNDKRYELNQLIIKKLFKSV